MCWVFVSVRGLSLVAASGGYSSSWCVGLSLSQPLVAEHRLQTRRLSSCGSRAQLLRSMWDLPRPGLEPMSPALAGRFSTTAPPGKPRGKPFDFSSTRVGIKCWGTSVGLTVYPVSLDKVWKHCFWVSSVDCLQRNCLRNLFNVHIKNDLLKRNFGSEVMETSHLTSSSGESGVCLLWEDTLQELLPRPTPCV